MSAPDFAPVARSLRTVIEANDALGPSAGGAGLDIHSTLVEGRGMPIVELLRRQLDPPSLAGVDVLDLGCGFGGLALLLAMHGAEVEAIDVKRHRLKVGHAVARRHGLAARFCRAQMEALPYEDDRFDAAVLNNALPYLVGHELRAQALREALRVVRPGGVIVVRSANRAHPRDAFSGLPLVHLLPPGAAVRVASALGRRRSLVRLTSRRGAARELERAGWTEARGVDLERPRPRPPAGLARYHHVVARRPRGS